MILISKKNSLKLDAEAKEVFDVSGAGDTVVSFIAAGMASSLKIESVVNIANIAAGVVVNKTGTSVAHLSEMLISANKSNYHLETENEAIIYGKNAKQNLKLNDDKSDKNKDK